MATLPAFPRKHRIAGVFGSKSGNSTEVVEERKRGLETYMNRVLEICAQLPDTLSVPEVDRFLDLSNQVATAKRRLGMGATANAGSPADELANEARHQPTTEFLTHSQLTN